VIRTERNFNNVDSFLLHGNHGETVDIKRPLLSFEKIKNIETQQTNLRMVYPIQDQQVAQPQPASLVQNELKSNTPTIMEA